MRRVGHCGPVIVIALKRTVIGLLIKWYWIERDSQNARTHHYRFMGTGSFFMNSNKSQNAEIQQLEGIDALLSLEEVMNLLGIGRTLLYKQMSNGELPWVQIGSTRHIRRADLIDFIERNRKGGRRVA